MPRERRKKVPIIKAEVPEEIKVKVKEAYLRRGYLTEGEYLRDLVRIDLEKDKAA